MKCTKRANCTKEAIFVLNGMNICFDHYKEKFPKMKVWKCSCGEMYFMKKEYCDKCGKEIQL